MGDGPNIGVSGKSSGGTPTLRQLLVELRDPEDAPGILGVLLVTGDAAPEHGATQESTRELPESVFPDPAKFLTPAYVDAVCLPLKVRRPGATIELIVGRSRDCAVFLDDPSVSKQHARLVIERASGDLAVIDGGSRNGTYVDGRRLDAGVRCLLWSGRHVRFGKPTFLIVDRSTMLKLAALERK